jgi:hypothetical protein
MSIFKRWIDNPPTLEIEATKALQETAEELFARAQRGEDVSREVEAWRQRVERMTSPFDRGLGRIDFAYVRTKATINRAVRWLVGQTLRKGGK